MRPLRLELEGFTCFRDRQIIDFESLDLYAIAGPTGAGKSSLLDAMIYALYGKVPRVGRSVAELVSLNEDKLAVRFDFRYDGRHYCISRVHYRSSTATRAQLDCIVDGTPQPVVEGVRDLNARVESLLGIGYEAFTQAVILPQGEFRKFLKSSGRDRRQILTELLRLGIYQRMRSKARSRARDLKGSLENLQDWIREEYGNIRPVDLKRKQTRLEELDEAIGKKEEARDKQRQVVEELKERRGWTKDQKARQSELDDLQKKTEEMTGLRTKLKRAERAAAIEGDLKALTAARTERREAKKTAEKAKKDRDRATEAVAEAKRALSEAEAKAEKLPELKKRTTELTELRGVVDHRKSVAEEKKKLEAKRATARKEQEEARSRKTKLTGDLEDKRDRLEKARKNRAAIGYEADREQALEEVEETARALRRHRHESREKKKEAEAAKTKAQKAEKEYEEAKTAHAAALSQKEKAETALEQATEHLTAARAQNKALALRQTLHEGEACPVCEQVVEQIPAQKEATELDRLTEAVDRAEAALNEAAQTERTREQKKESARQEAERAAEEATALTEASTGLAETVRNEETALKEKTKTLIEATEEEIEEAVLTELERLGKARRKDETARKEVENLKEDLRELEKKRETAEAAIASARKAIAGYDGQIKEKQTTWARLDEKIASVLGRDVELKPELDRVEAEQKALTEALESARSALAEAEKKEAAAQTGHEKAAERLERADAALRNLNEEVSKKVDEAGFSDPDEAKTALLSRHDRDSLQKRLDTWEKKCHTLKDQLADLEKKLKAGKVTAEALAEATGKLDDAEKALEAKKEERGRLKHEAETLEEKLEKRAKREEELKEKKAEHALYRELSLELQSDRFQAYLLDEMFRDLVRGASERLHEMSDRYTLVYEEDDFYVLDHDNARQKRSADTLSGGETFLASLSLALELSAQVQKQSGSGVLDCIFIDEGFGTLDPETLDTVASAIESLPTGGRMVGIITHIRELYDRLPTKLQVEKKVEGSEVEVVGA